MPSRIEQGKGVRFNLNLDYDSDHIGAEEHPSLVDRDSEESTQLVVKIHAVNRLVLVGGKTESSVNLLKDVPLRARLVAVTYPIDYIRQTKRDAGIDIDSGEQSWRLPQTIWRSGEKTYLSLPVYQLRRTGEELDRTAERLVRNIGRTRALNRGITAEPNLAQEEEHYLGTILGNPPVQD